MQRYESLYKPVLAECVIVGSKFNGNIYLAKNRDRAYKPTVKIIHELVDGLEVAYMLDVLTDYSEGLNSSGIGIINSALMVIDDEREADTLKKSGEKGKDGDKIRKALSFTTKEEAIKSVVTYTTKKGDNILNGHTFVGDSKSITRIESTSETTPIIINTNTKNIMVRTNHGHSYKHVGYTDGELKMSSLYRQGKIKSTLTKSDMPLKILKKLRRTFFKKNSNFNPFRDTDFMNTTSQILLDLTNLVLYFYPIDKKCKFLGVENRLPKGYNSQINIKVLTAEDI